MKESQTDDMHYAKNRPTLQSFEINMRTVAFKERAVMNSIP